MKQTTFPDLMSESGFNPLSNGPAWLGLKARVSERTVRRAMGGSMPRPVVVAAFAAVMKTTTEKVEESIQASKVERSAK